MMGKQPARIRGQPLRSEGVDRWVRIALVFYGGLAFAAWAWRTALGGESLLHASPEAATRGLGVLSGVASGAAVAAALIGASRLLTRHTLAGRTLAGELAGALGSLRGWQIAVLALASGVGEELFFRGALQPRVGLPLASLLFGLAHLVPSWPLALWSLFAASAGLLFGLLFEATGNLLAPVLAHVVVNAVNLRWLVREANDLRI